MDKSNSWPNTYKYVNAIRTEGETSAQYIKTYAQV